jgi:hypothetical protein
MLRRKSSEDMSLRGFGAFMSLLVLDVKSLEVGHRLKVGLTTWQVLRLGPPNAPLGWPTSRP